MICRFWFILIASALLAGFMLIVIANHPVLRDFFLSRLSGGIWAGQKFYNFITVAMIAIILVVSASLVFIIYYAYRVAGPLFNIEKALKEIGRTGDLAKRIKLRAQDEANLKEFVEVLNEMLEDIEGRVYGIKVRIEEMNQEIERIKDCQSLPEVKSALEEIQILKESLNQSCALFKFNNK
ncbi:MAG TPA: hypothetical protein PLH56_03600 [Candidatus Omnitrophota bacterium]|nr:hypothetical protein [Candidatus Omnitrophota bacterium]